MLAGERWQLAPGTSEGTGHGDQGGRTPLRGWGGNLALLDLLSKGQHTGRHSENAEGATQDLLTRSQNVLIPQGSSVCSGWQEAAFGVPQRMLCIQNVPLMVTRGKKKTILSFTLGHMLFQIHMDITVLFHFICQRLNEVGIPHFRDEDQRHKGLPKITQPVRGRDNLESTILLCLILQQN